MSQFSASLIGEELAGYKVTELIGEGGMAVVMKAENMVDPRIKRAFKIIKPEYRDRAQFYERFTREAFVLERLRSKYLVTFHGLRQEKSQLFIELELLEGFSLDKLPAPYDRPSLDAVVQWMYQAAIGLAEAHEQQILHRDIKPGNLYLHQEQTIKILDFGIAKVTNEIENQQHETLQGHVLGSPAFMAPEVCEGKESSPQADIYGLALIAYQLILGYHPLIPRDRTLNTMQVMMTHIQVDLPSIKTQCSSCPELEKILKKAASKEKKHRYATGKEFAEALKPLLKTTSFPIYTDRNPSFNKLDSIEKFSWLAPLMTFLLLVVSAWSFTYKWNHQKSKVVLSEKSSPLKKTKAKALPLAPEQRAPSVDSNHTKQKKPKMMLAKTDDNKRSQKTKLKGQNTEQHHIYLAKNYLEALDLTWISLPDDGQRSRSILKTEVTVEQYALCVKAKACTANFKDKKTLFGECTYPLRQLKLPVNCVTLNEAKTFTNWIDSLYQQINPKSKSNSHGRFVLLPNLNDWQSALGGQLYPWGAEPATCSQAIFFERSPSCIGKLGPQEVCSKPKGNNPNGACDLYGNLWEWISEPEQDDSQLALTIGGAWSSASVDLKPNAVKKRPPNQRDPSVGIRLIYLH